MSDYKTRIRKATENYVNRKTPKAGLAKRKNGKPEKLVEIEVVSWCSNRKFDISVIEAKGVYSQAAGRYLKGQVEDGYSDISGNTETGLACYIELKAPGKRSTLRAMQRAFLIRKINSGAFAVVIDSAQLLQLYYRTYMEHRRDLGFQKGKEYLLSILPKEKNQRDDSSEIMGF